jgi:hypothetical protein
MGRRAGVGVPHRKLVWAEAQFSDSDGALGVDERQVGRQRRRVAPLRVRLPAGDAMLVDHVACRVVPLFRAVKIDRADPWHVGEPRFSPPWGVEVDAQDRLRLFLPPE